MEVMKSDSIFLLNSNSNGTPLRLRTVELVDKLLRGRRPPVSNLIVWCDTALNAGYRPA